MKISATVEVRDGKLVIEVPIEKVFDEEKIQLKSLDALTMREREVLAGLCARKSNKQIAEELRIAVRTVKFRVSKLSEKTSGGSNRWDVVVQFSNIDGSGEIRA